MDFTRTLPRLKTSLAFILPDGWRGDVVDLSATGLRMQCLALLERDTQVTGKLVFPDGREVTLAGTVVWTSPPAYAEYVPAEIGLELTSAPQAYLDALASLFADG